MYIPAFSEIMAVSQSRGADSDAPHLWRGLVGAWPFQEGGGSTAFDASGFGRNGTLTSMDPATDHVVGDKGRALGFANLSDDRVDATKPGNWSGTEGTFACWAAKTASTASNNDYIIWTHFASGTDRIFLEVETFAPGGTSTAQWTANWGDGNNVAGGATITLNRWTHLAVTWAVGVPVRLYVDGLLSASSSNFAAQSDVATEQIGNYVSGNNLGFGGRISDARRHNHALSPNEVAELYADPWAAYRLRRRKTYFVPAAAPGGNAPLFKNHLHKLMVG